MGGANAAALFGLGPIAVSIPNHPSHYRAPQLLGSRSFCKGSVSTAWGPRHTAVQIQQRLERGKLLRLKRNDKHIALRHAELLALGTSSTGKEASGIGSDIVVMLAFVLGGTFMFLQATNRVAGLGCGLCHWPPAIDS